MKSKGQSLVEVIIAVSIFVIIAGSSVVVVLGSFITSRLAEDETQAASLAVEGIEAVSSIKNKSWDNLTDGNHGLSNSGNEWTFSESEDINGKYARVINVSSVLRNNSDEIVDSDGASDNDTKKITSTITWDFTPARQSEVEMVAYLTNWQEARKVAACSEYCQLKSYQTGTCRRNVSACSTYSEVNLQTGDRYCTGGSTEDTCCCVP